MPDEPRFRKSNPDFTYGNPCVYVGMTGLSPDVRFDKHKAGIQANCFVTQYGVRLLPELYEVYNPMPYDAARDIKIEMYVDGDPQTWTADPAAVATVEPLVLD